jgi:thiamine biosynthesis lipoprotein
MGSSVEILLCGDGEARAGESVQEAEELAEDWTRSFSRFLPGSELSLLNAAGGAPRRVSPRMFAAVESAADASRLTHGLFNPLVLPALVAHGYDRSFELIEGAVQAPASLRSPAAIDAIRLDARQRTVQLPPEGMLDLGGIAKGLFADTLAQSLGAWPGGVVSAGGDMRVWGQGPDDGAWLVGVEDPGNPERDIAYIRLNEGGIATSGANRRSWTAGAGRAHHIIDPRNGKPAHPALDSVTVIAPTATLAEVGATALFIDSSQASLNVLSGSLWAAILVDGRRPATLKTFNPKALTHVYFTINDQA